MSAKDIWPRYGVLNDINKPVTGPRIDLQNPDIGGVIRSVINNAYAPNAVLGTGPYKGICLRVEGRRCRCAGPGLAGSWASKAFSYITGTGTAKGPDFVQIKVRIPELHSMMPIPESLAPDDKNSNKDNSIIDMYPTFIAQSTDVPAPKPGDFVWVDYGNKNNFTDPIYIKPVVGMAPLPVGVGSPSAAGAHGGCVGSSNSVRPLGDVLSGQNRALSHSGLPLLPRGTAKSVSNEFRTIKGSRWTPKKLAQWESGVAKGVPGTTWFGVMNSNGLVDPQHPDGVRNTVIYAPNTTDFSVPFELMYFFHGSSEFGGHDFGARFPNAIKQLVEQRRNFVLVIPELAWCQAIKPNRQRVSASNAWHGRDNFTNFHREVLEILRGNFSSKINVGFVSVTAHSSGGYAILGAAQTGGLAAVKPNKITFADASFSQICAMVWDLYGSKNEVEFNMLVGSAGTQYSPSIGDAKALVRKSGGKATFVEMMGRNHMQIGDLGLGWVNEKNKEAMNAASDKNVSDTKDDPVPNDEAINAMEPMTAGMNEESKKLNSDKTLKTPGPKPPPAGNVKLSPSAVNKSSGTKKPSSVVIVPAEVYRENRVRLDDYGVLESNSSVLVNVPSSGKQQQKAHKLLATRLALMSAAWQADNPGTGPILVGSGWRPSSTLSEEQFNQWLITPKDKFYAPANARGLGYASVELGRKAKAWKSAHTTGLAIDLQCYGVKIGLSTNERSKQTVFFQWLKNNMHRWSFTPFDYESWHLELVVPRESWATGEEFVEGNNFAVRVINPGKSNNMPQNGGVNQSCLAQLGSYKGNA